MNILKIKKNIFWLLAISFLFFPFLAYSQTINIDASKLLANVEILLSPRAGSFVEGSTFQVPILVNTRGNSINGIEVRVDFDKDKLAIVNPTGGTSIIGVWTEPPRYDNTNGTANYVGVIPEGIIAQAGLVGTITFKAKVSGRAIVSINSNSRILLNDGLGTSAQTGLGRAEYTILTKAPEGVQVFSDTHPIQSDWYNNNTPVLSWQRDDNVGGFSFILDNKPNTIPDNVIDGDETIKSFEALSDGLWYFHIKANKAGVWGTTGHFLVRIDTTSPAKFTPEINYLLATTILADRTLVSFFTTDNLSGINHYEVGVIDKVEPATESPVFVQADSPFQMPLNVGGKFQVIVRAVDKAGNVQDGLTEVNPPFTLGKFVKDYFVHILIGIIILGSIAFTLHYFFGSHIILHLRRILAFIKEEKSSKN